MRKSSVSSRVNPRRARAAPASMPYLFWISAQTPSVPGRLRLTRRWIAAAVSS